MQGMLLGIRTPRALERHASGQPRAFSEGEKDSVTHISWTSPHRQSPTPYSRGKNGQLTLVNGRPRSISAMSVAEARQRFDLFPAKAPPPGLPSAIVLLPRARPVHDHDGRVRFLYVSGEPIFVGTGRDKRPLVVSCSFRARWGEVLAQARRVAGFPLFLTAPRANDTDHALTSGPRAREVYASVVLVPPTTHLV